MAAMAAVTLAQIGFFAFLMIQMTAPQMVPLFTDLSVEDSASIVKDLDRQAIAYEIKNDGASARWRSKIACAIRSKASSPRWSAPATPEYNSPRISISTASPIPRTSLTRIAACCHGRHLQIRARRRHRGPAGRVHHWDRAASLGLRRRRALLHNPHRRRRVGNSGAGADRFHLRRPAGVESWHRRLRLQ